jgi:hypothetical protein
VGHSCGGALLLLAEEAEPGTFDALYCYEPVVMLMEPPPSADDPVVQQNPLALRTRRRREVFDSYHAALANFSSKPPMEGLQSEALAAYVHYGFEPVDPAAPDGPVRLKCRAEDEARTYENAPPARRLLGPRLGGLPGDPRLRREHRRLRGRHHGPP